MNKIQTPLAHIIFLFLFMTTITFAQSPEVELLVQSGHTDQMQSMAFSPDGSLLATSALDEKIILWDMRLGLHLTTLDAVTLTRMKFSPDGKYLFGVVNERGNDAHVSIWDIEKEKRLLPILEAEAFKADMSLALSPDGTLLAVCADGAIFVYRWQEGKLLYTIEVEQELKRDLYSFSGIDFSPDGKYFVNGKNVTRFNAKEKYSEAEVRQIADGKIVSRIRKIKQEDSIFEISQVHFITRSELAIIYSPGSSSATEIALWDWQQNEKKAVSPEIKTYDQILFDPGKKQFLAEGSEEFRVLEYPFSTAGKTLPVEGTIIHGLAWHPTTQVAALSTSLGEFGRIRLYNTQTGVQMGLWDAPLGKVTSVSFTANGLLAVANKRYSPRVWDLRTNAGFTFFTAGTYIPLNGEYANLHLVENGNRLIYTNHNYAYYWNLTQPSLQQDLPEHYPSEKRVLAISPDEQLVASYTGSIIDLQTMRIVKKIAMNRSPGTERSVTFSPDNKFLLNSGHQFIQRWRLPEFEQLPDIKVKYKVSQIQVSLQGILAYIESGSVNLRNIESGELLHSWKIRANDLVFSPDGNTLLIATEKYIEIYDVPTRSFKGRLEGHQLPINCLFMSPNGRLLASGSDDGFVKLWDWKAQKLIATLAGLGLDDFIIYTPDHYYMTKRGVGKAAFRFEKDKLYPFEQFDLQYNRPDIVLERMGFADKELIQAFRRAHKKRLEKLGYTEDEEVAFDQMPQVNFTNEILQNTSDSTFTLQLNARDDRYQLTSLHVLVNEVPIYGEKGKPIRNGKTFNGTIQVPLLSGNNRIHVFVTNEKGVSSLWETFDLFYNGKRDKPDLYLVTIGVSKYKNPKMNLRYATEDAKDVTSLFQARPGLFRKSYYYQFWDEQATRESILSVKSVLANSRPQDLVVVFLAGHGVLDQNLDYYFASHDMDFQNPAKRGLRFEELENLLDGIPALQKTLLIDACHAGEVDKDEVELIEGNTSSDGKIIFRSLPNYTVRNKQLGLTNSFELMKHLFTDLRRKSGAVVIAAAGGAEYALEGEDYQNGIFTYTLLKGLQETQDKEGFVLADLNQDEAVSIKELQDYLITNVAKFTNNRQQPLTRVDYLYNEFTLLKYNRGKRLKPNFVNFSKAELEEMIDSGLDLSQKDENGATVLMRVVYNLVEDDPAIIAKLINYGADPFQKGIIYPKSSGGYIGNLLSTAAVGLKPKMLEYLIQKAKIPVDDREWNPDTNKEDGWTALQWAAVSTSSKKAEAVEVVDVLLKNGANINEQRSGPGSTPLLLALGKGENMNTAIANLLIDKGADLAVVDKNGWNALHYAIRYGHYKIAEKLIAKGLKADQPAKDGTTPVALALKNQNYLCLDALLNSGPSIKNIVDQSGDQQAKEISLCQKSHRTLLAAIFDENQTAVREQLSAGANLNARDRHEATFFMHIVHHFKLPFIKEMVEQGGDFRKKGVIWIGQPGDGYYGNLMGLAAAKNDYALLEYFIKTCKIPVDDQEYDPATKTETGWTALQWAASNGASNVIPLLIEQGANLNVGENKGETPLLLFMRNYSNSRISQLIMDSGANMLAKDIDGATALHYACRDELYDQGGRFLAHKIIEGGLSINALDNFNWTPLMYAANKGHQLLCQWLIKNGADCKLTNKDGQTALDLAQKKGYYRAVNVLKECQ